MLTIVQAPGLAERILQDPLAMVPNRRWVNVYEEYQVYGGPEEGGWWAVGRRLQAGREFLTEQHAREYIASIQKELEEQSAERQKVVDQKLSELPDDQDQWNMSEGYIPIGFVGGEQLVVMIETAYGASEHAPNLTYDG